MYNPIQINHVPSKKRQIEQDRFMENFSLLTAESNDPEVVDLTTEVYTEAVFINGKKLIQPIVDQIQKIKDILNEQIELQDKTVSEGKPKIGDKTGMFDPKTFWKNTEFRTLENIIKDIFGFRAVSIEPFIEKYNSKEKIFSTRIMNCLVFLENRYPIDGIVTEKGFYDKTHSANMNLRISLGLFKALDADEIAGVLLHEFGHGIDPAMVDINFTEVNIISKYLTDRNGSLNRAEQNVLKKKKAGISSILITLLIYLGVVGITLLGSFIMRFINGSKKRKEARLNKIKDIIKKDEKFTRQNYSEAFADNFARMYGFAAPLMSGLKKITKDGENQLHSRFKKERARQEAILTITEYAMKDVHKTDIHRIRALIKEYHDDINDSNTPSILKKQLEDDVNELEKVLDSYLNDFDEFQNRINKMINEELMKGETDTDDDSEKSEKIDDNKKEELVKEGFQFFDEEVFEEKKYEHPLKKRMDEECPLDRGDKSKIDEKFGNSRACSWAKDKDGYFCYTHRCRSKSYKTINDIPQKDVDFVRSTC